MVYNGLLYAALTVFGVGLAYKISGWFFRDIGIGGQKTTISGRFCAFLKGLGPVFFGPKLLTLARVFVVDVLFQNHIRKQDALRWIMHMLIFVGFTFLLFTHALDRVFLTSLYAKYYLAPNPFLLVSGFMVLAGLGIAACRRLILKAPRLRTNAMDAYMLVLLAVVLVSGMAMELTKLTSYVHYQKIWDIHILACLFGLGYLPFSKMFHVLTTPLSLLANAVMDENSDPANIKTRQAMELDACMHCGNCTRRCSVAVAFDAIGNENILPSERMTFLKKYIVHKDIDPEASAAIAQGIYLCTNCDRCTVICPAGINLRDLWFNVREEVISRGDFVPLMLTSFSLYRGLKRSELDPDLYEKPLQKARKAVTAPFEVSKNADAVVLLTPAGAAFKKTSPFSAWGGTYAYCFTCENCSTVCPVVGNYENPQEYLDLLPHQIIRSLGFGLKDLAMGSRMLWYCLTCYQCQEHCPQGVKVTDIFYELKNLALKEAYPCSDRAVSVGHALR